MFTATERGYSFLLICAAAALSSCSHDETFTRTSAAQSISPLQEVEIYHETLPNGFQVVLSKTPSVEGQERRAFVASYILHGVLDERRLGWAHLMEHVSVNNRANVAGPQPPEGGKRFDSNAMARARYTSFFVIVSPDLVPSAVHGRMARAGHTQDDPAVFTTEVGRVTAELERDTASQYPAFSALIALSAGKQPGLSAELASVRSADQASVGAMMADLYRPDNSILVVAGDIDLAATRAAVHDSAARLGWGGPGAAPARPNPAGPNGKSESINTGVSAVVAGQNSSDHNIVGLGWPKPAPGDKDQLAMLVVDQILLGGRDDPSNLRRSDASPLGRRLASAVGGKDFWDRIDDLATPPLADPGAALQVVLFNTKHDLGPAETRRAVRQALLDIRKRELGDTMIETARDKLAAYYDRWLVEPRHRTLAEHLMAYQVTGRSPSEVKQIPSGIRRVRPVEVRRAFERRLLAVEPLVVVLPRIATPQRPQG